MAALPCGSDWTPSLGFASAEVYEAIVGLMESRMTAIATAEVSG